MKATNHQTNQTHCSLCGGAFPSKPHTGASGYATLSDGRQICYPCADKLQREELKDRTKPFVAYLSGDKVTTWTGGQLMRVTESRPCKLTRQSFTHDRGSYRSVHCVDCHGGHWSGRGSDGIAIKLRPVKS